MITWLRLWPLLVVPYIVFIIIGAAPLFTIRGIIFGGPLIREWFLNQTLLPILPNESGWIVVAWFNTTSVAGEYALYLLITFNIYVFFCIPVLFIIGQFFVNLTGWYNATDLALKRQAIK